MRHPHLVAPHAPRPFAARRAAFPAFGEAEAAMNPVGWLRAVLIGAFAAAILLHSVDGALGALVVVLAVELMRIM